VELELAASESVRQQAGDGPAALGTASQAASSAFWIIVSAVIPSPGATATPTLTVREISSSPAK
jgi:hypothetical protein